MLPKRPQPPTAMRRRGRRSRTRWTIASAMRSTSRSTVMYKSGGRRQRPRSTGLAPLFDHYEQVYGAGQFTWAGLWTVGDPPEVAHEQLVDAWELYLGGTISRWRLPVRDEARVFEVHRPADWAQLVMDHPGPARERQEGWELPGENQAWLPPLTAVPGQRAARATMRRHLVPDWRSAADRYDGVHLSWAGFITAEGCITGPRRRRRRHAPLPGSASGRTGSPTSSRTPSPRRRPCCPSGRRRAAATSPSTCAPIWGRRRRDESALRRLLDR